MSANSSSLGNVTILTGAIQFLASARLIWLPFPTYTAAPYAFVLASLKEQIAIGKWKTVNEWYAHGSVRLERFSMSVTIANHLSLSTVDSGSSHEIFLCQSYCRKVLALMVTEVAQPRGL